MNPTADYSLLAKQAEALLSESDMRITNAANLSALIYQNLPDVNWAGFYFLEHGELWLGPFQGKPACVRIPLGQGVCGVAAQQETVQRIADVHRFDGHIACDVDSRSELVIPLVKQGELIGVLDLDSPHTDRFSEADAQGVSRLASIYLESIR